MAGSLAAVVAGCFEDLPAPTECPPPARHVAQDCTAALEDPPAGCLSQERMSCLAGSRSTCTCVVGECPQPEAACYPDGDCPARVVQGVGAAARCRRLRPDQFGAGYSSEQLCLCGCAGCAAVCDGTGPVMGVHATQSHPAPALLVDLSGRMPDSGRLGIYLRLRGLASFVLVVVAGTTEPGELATHVRWYYPVLTPLGTSFTEHVIFDDDFVGVEAYSWSLPADRPTVIGLMPQGKPDESALALFELDCILPFVLPLK
ncbi:MAG: hypothetical protein HY744_12050 [Deltaproteobacteria bacterium]|nr:hypothetical protein [Deltaproteobacteria bacterium]